MGNPGKRPLGEIVPAPKTGEAFPPEFLEKNARALAIWDDLAPVLTILGTLRKESQYLLAALCWLQADFEAAPSDCTAANLTNIRAISSSLGMDPSTQAKFIRPPSEDVIDPAEAFFGPTVLK